MPPCRGSGCVREYVCVVLMGDRREGWGEERGGVGRRGRKGNGINLIPVRPLGLSFLVSPGCVSGA